MFIRPVGPVVHPAQRPAGRPLLRGLLARGAYVWNGGEASRQAAPPPAGPAEAAAPPASELSPTAAPPGNLADQLARLSDLAREGLLTAEEFASAKSRLLGGG
ncbi:SHOCT domain-containing protein [Streptomyces sp. NPDC051211]|uniref:SHOCT domain-containing protein n=1 Tax=Streptomyces sp. NPDC051211 TaxID=3154643 RepID=UPI00344F121F